MTPGVNINRYEVEGELTRAKIKEVLDLSRNKTKINRVDSLDNWKTLVESTTSKDYEALYNWRRLTGSNELRNNLRSLNKEKNYSKSKIQKILLENGMTYSNESKSTITAELESRSPINKSKFENSAGNKITENVGDDERIILARQRWENIKASIGISGNDKVTESYKYWDRLAYAPKNVEMITTDFETPFSKKYCQSNQSTTSSKQTKQEEASTISKKTSGKDNSKFGIAKSNSKVALYNWNLITKDKGTSEISKEKQEGQEEVFQNWQVLTKEDETIVIPRKEAIENWKLLNSNVGTPKKEWSNVVKSSSFNEFEAYLNWERLILGDVIPNGSSRKASIYPEKNKSEEKKKNKKSFVLIVKEKLFPKLAAKQEKKKTEDAEENWSKLVNSKVTDLQMTPVLSNKIKSVTQISSQPRNISIEKEEQVSKESEVLLRYSPIDPEIDRIRGNDIIDNELRFIKEEVKSGKRVLTFQAADCAKDIIVTLSSKGVSGAQIHSNDTGNVHVTLHSKIDEDYNVCMSIVGGDFEKEYKLMELSRTFGSMDKSEKHMTRLIIEKLKIQIENDEK